jgi:hypothetical protein
MRTNLRITAEDVGLMLRDVKRKELGGVALCKPHIVLCDTSIATVVRFDGSIIKGSAVRGRIGPALIERFKPSKHVLLLSSSVELYNSIKFLNNCVNR